MHGQIQKPDRTAKPARTAWTPPLLSVIVPTFNERDNIAPLVTAIGKALEGIVWEMIVVDDDSPDGTAGVVKAIARENPNIHCIRRVGRRGLSSACIEGISASAAPFVAVMDADHQHDETLLAEMLGRVQGGKDIAVASRFAGGASTTAGLSAGRRALSRMANRGAALISGVKLTDPMSGFFLMRRSLFDAVAPGLAQEGFKIFLDIVVTARRAGHQLKIDEIPFAFRQRRSGESKLNALIGVQFVGLFLSKLTNGLLPATFLLFAMVGVTGIFVHLAVLTVADGWLGWSFLVSQSVATIVAMTTNFILNNELTYADKKLRGTKFWIGLLSFYAVCSIGAVANVSVATMIYAVRPGIYVAGIAGAIMSAVFNYAMTRIFTWR